MKSGIIILALLACTISIAAQSVVLNLPDTSAIIDAKVRAECQMTVDIIDNPMGYIHLKCDTLFKELREDVRIYLDEEGNLKKYFRYWATEIEGSVMSAYYNDYGELVYIYIYSENNCDISEESLYVHKGILIDFAWKYDCGCCEEDKEALYAAIENERPVIGTLLLETPARKWNLRNFFHANTLLSILKSKNYYEGMVFEYQEQ